MPAENETLVFDTPDGIAFFRLCSIRGAVKLEIQGIRFRGGSRYAAAKRIYGIKGSRESVLKQLDAMIEEAHDAKQRRALLAAEPAGTA